MKFSYNWICELVEGVDATPKELMRLITMKTAECEGVEPCGDDWIIEIDNKSLTHRPDLWGHHGMAREVAAILRKPLKEPARLELIPEGGAEINVEILDFALCPRYSLLVFDNVTVQPSPEWLRRRLESIGLNSINNIVDVTNYVLAEIAQPMHAFDAATLQGGTIFVRRARAGEKIVALNEERYELDETNQVIADARGPIAIAGVIGGLDTGIVDTTRRVALESANFHASNVRKTSAKLKLRTDASIRYEKAQDPVNTLRGLARAVELFQQVSPGIRIAGGLVDCRKELPAPPPIKLPMDWLLRKLGRPIEPAEVRDILERLHFAVEEPEPRVFSVSVPSWRATRDVSLKDDLVEEIGRIVGYDTIPPAAPLLPASVPPVNQERRFHHQVRDMAAAQGFTEVYNYSFVSEDLARRFGFEPAAHVAVANPISEEQGLMRLSLVPNIWRNITENAKHFERFRLFEIGYEIRKRASGELPDEVPHLAAAIFSREDGQDGIYELKRLAECLMRASRRSPPKRVRSNIRRARPSSPGAAPVWGGCSSCIRRWSRPGAPPSSKSI